MRDTETNKSRFLVRQDIATDLQTGLMWMRYPLGSIHSNGEFFASLYTWDDAVTLFGSQGAGWRLPALSELLTLIKDGEGGQEAIKIDTDVFPLINIHSEESPAETLRYWTSNPCDGSGRCMCGTPHSHTGHCCCAFVVGFWFGNFLADNKSHRYAIRLVRKEV